MFSITLDKDSSVWEKMRKEALKPNVEVLRVGFFPGDNYGPENDSLPVAQIAAWNEYGTITNPPRPFMRVGIGTPLRRGVYNSYFTDSIKRIVEGKSSFRQEYAILGKVLVEDMKEVIEKWDSPPNSPRTVEEKGFNDPLVWTGTMHDSVKAKVEKEGGG